MMMLCEMMFLISTSSVALEYHSNTCIATKYIQITAFILKELDNTDQLIMSKFSSIFYNHSPPENMIELNKSTYKYEFKYESCNKIYRFQYYIIS